MDTMHAWRNFSQGVVLRKFLANIWMHCGLKERGYGIHEHPPAIFVQKLLAPARRSLRSSLCLHCCDFSRYLGDQCLAYINISCFRNCTSEILNPKHAFTLPKHGHREGMVCDVLSAPPPVDCQCY